MSFWTTTGPLHVARDGYGIVSLSGTTALVIGGASNFPSFTATCEIYDHNTETWALTGVMSRANGEGLYITLNNGNVLAVGGLETGLVYSAVCELYDPNTGLWAPTGSLSQGRADHGGIWKLPSGKILVAGGQIASGSAATATCEIYDPNTALWSPAASLYTPISNMAFTTLGDGRPLWAGGWTDNHATTIARTYTYDENTDTWTRQADLPNIAGFQNCRAGITLSNGNAFVFGGYDNNATPQVRAYLYDQNINTWSSSSSAIFALAESTLALVSTDRVLQYAVRNSSQTQVYNYLTDTWATGHALIGETSGQTYSNNGVIFSDEKILNAGGQNHSGISITTTEIFSGASTMGIALVQKVAYAAASGTNPFALTATAPVGAGNLGVVWFGGFNNSGFTITTVVDDMGNAYVQIPSTVSGQSGANESSEMWYCKNLTAGGTVITVTGTGTPVQTMAYIFEFSGANVSTPLDTGNFAKGSGGSQPVSGLVTPSANTNVLVAAAVSGSVVLTGISTSSWISTADNIIEPQTSGYLLTPAVSSQQATFSPAGNASFAASIASFIASSSGPSATKKTAAFLVV